MIQLTTKEAAIYEGIKAGMSLRDIAVQVGIHRVTVSGHISFLIAAGLVEKTGKIDRFFTYRAIPQSYEIVKHKNKKNDRVIVDTDDQILREALHVQLTDEQQLYLDGHRQTQKRTILAKKLGITKLQLNFILDKPGERV